MTDERGTIRADGDRFAVRFERHYPVGPADLWASLTEPERLRRWLAEVVDGRLEPGGEFTFRWDGDDDQTAHCRVRLFEPPKVLELSWSFTGEPDSVLRLELSADGAGTLLVLDHRQLPPNQAAGYGAGWQAYLDTLAGLDAAGWDARFAEFLPGYREQLAALG